MPADQRFERLIELISKSTGIDPALLTDSASLFHDLGVAGDDGFELLEAIAKEFEIDLSEVDNCRYFGPEGAYNPLCHLYYFLRGKKAG